VKVLEMPAGRVLCQFAIEPGQVFLGAIDDGEREDFRDFVGVDGGELGAQGGEEIAAGLDEEQEFGGIFNGVLPAINAARIGQNVDAGGQTLFDQMASDALGLLSGAAGGEDNDFVGHFYRIFADFGWACGPAARYIFEMAP